MIVAMPRSGLVREMDDRAAQQAAENAANPRL
jgi:hypothetical protein